MQPNNSQGDNFDEKIVSGTTELPEREKNKNFGDPAAINQEPHPHRALTGSRHHTRTSCSMTQGNQSRKCDTCNNTYSSSNYVSVHRQIHFPPTFKCEYCPKMFHLKQTKDSHMVVHTRHNKS